MYLVGVTHPLSYNIVFLRTYVQLLPKKDIMDLIKSKFKS